MVERTTMTDPFSAASLYGAVDLSSLKKPAAPAAPAAQPATGPGVVDDGEGPALVPGPWELEVTGENLQGALIMSQSVPVVLAFYSERSANSGKLVESLSGLAKRFAGRFQFGKISVDTQPEVAQAFGANPVPAATALLSGQPIPLFQGLPDDAQLTDTVAQLLEAAAQYGVTGVLDGDAEAATPEPEVPPLHKAGLEALQAGDLEAASAAYHEALRENPGDTEAKSALTQVELLQRVAALNPAGGTLGAQKVLEEAKDAPLTDIEKHLAAADIETAFQRPDAAFGRLIDVISVTSGDDRDAVRKRLLDLFEVVGPHTELVAAARKALTNALF